MKETKDKNRKKLVYIKSVLSTYSIWKLIALLAVILSFVLYVDSLNIISKKILSDTTATIIAVGILVFIFAIFMDGHMLEMKKMVVINLYDATLIFIHWLSIGYLISGTLIGILSEYKIIASVLAVTISAILICARECEYYSAHDVSLKYTPSTIDLKDLYEGKIELGHKKLFFPEKEVDYDLLEKKSIINYLYNTICQCNPEESFVISLEGRWGSGKTTILKNVKRIAVENNPDLLIIDDFDPWSYGSERSIVKGLFDSILKTNDLQINTMEFRKCLAVLGKAIVKSDDAKSVIDNMLLREKTVVESKRQINEYLRLSNKKYVIFIDNLERTNKENIIFLFKLIGNVLDFNRVVYVLSFDSEKIRMILNQDEYISYKYLEKIIQLSINVPELDKDILNNVVSVCTNNLSQALHYDTGTVYVKEFIDIISENVTDLRDYKRLMNSIFFKVINQDTNLYKRDMLVIEFLKNKHYSLYKIISDNDKYFVSHAVMHDPQLLYKSWNKEIFEPEKKSFFEGLFSNEEHRKYTKLLALIFPNVNEYVDKTEFLNIKPLDDKEIERYRSIASAKYFHLYFSETENDYSLLGGLVDRIIDMMNGSVSDYVEEFKYVLQEVDCYAHVEIMESIEAHIPVLQSKGAFRLFDSLSSCFWEIDDSLLFLRQSGKQRCVYIMSKLIFLMSDEDFERVLQKQKDAYDRIEMINNILYWLEHEDGNISCPERTKRWKDVETRLAANIIEREINLYDDANYHWRNIWGLYRIYKDQECVFRTYMQSIYSPKYLFRILYDALGSSVGKDYRYYFKHNLIELLFNVQMLDKSIKELDIKSRSDDEKLLIELYERYINNTGEEIEGGKTFGEEINLEL